MNLNTTLIHILSPHDKKALLDILSTNQQIELHLSEHRTTNGPKDREVRVALKASPDDIVILTIQYNPIVNFVVYQKDNN